MDGETKFKVQAIEFTGKIVEDHLTGLQKKFFLFQARDISDAPTVLVHLLGKCIDYLKREEAASSTQT
jgi:hypothetical protein